MSIIIILFRCVDAREERMAFQKLKPFFAVEYKASVSIAFIGEQMSAPKLFRSWLFIGLWKGSVNFLYNRVQLSPPRLRARGAQDCGAYGSGLVGICRRSEGRASGDGEWELG